MNIAQTVGLRRAALAKHLSNSMPSQPSNKQNRLMSRLSFRRLKACLLLFVFASQTLGKNLPVALPSSVGMSAERLARIDAAVAESIAR
ncbi:MAG TPA: hypothetical protein VIQ24_09020, partial [Pyrinomonadaceae bacterium]